jgi:hypothetical protein
VTVELVLSCESPPTMIDDGFRRGGLIRSLNNLGASMKVLANFCENDSSLGYVGLKYVWPRHIPSGSVIFLK